MNVKLNMKKVVSLLLGCALAGTLLAGCGPTDDPHKSSGGKPLKLGMLTNMNISQLLSKCIHSLLARIKEPCQFLCFMVQ